MKTPYVILLLFAFTFGAYAQQQTSTLPPMQLWESVAYKTSTMDNQLAVGVTPVDTLNNTDTLILSRQLMERGDVLKFTLRFANTMDSIRFEQYDLNGDTWYTLPVTYKWQGVILPAGSAWQRTPGSDTTSANGWVTPVGTSLFTGTTWDISIPNRTNGDIRCIRVPNDTGTVKFTYVLKGKL